MLGPPDFIIISGDLTQSGEQSQFDDLEQHFIRSIRKAARSYEDLPVLVVPGNHDLRRASAKTVNGHLLLALTSVKSLNDFLDSDEFVEMVGRPFAHFYQFGTT